MKQKKILFFCCCCCCHTVKKNNIVSFPNILIALLILGWGGKYKRKQIFKKITFLSEIFYTCYKKITNAIFLNIGMCSYNFSLFPSQLEKSL